LAFRAPRDQVEEKHWWFVGRRAVLRALARPLPEGPRLDVGCGYRPGLDSAPDSRLTVGLDVDPARLANLSQRPGIAAVQGDSQRLPFADASFASVMMLDVLEHIEDDWLALAEAFRVLAPGGAALVTVPAFPSLWSAHDESEMHFRRYRRKELLSLCESAGFTVSRSGHFNVALFPLAAAWRLVSRRLFRRRRPRDDFYMLPRPIDSVLASLLALERHAAPYIPLPFGLSIYALLGKPIIGNPMS
jgi:SAM-dependent methyltransferase